MWRALIVVCVACGSTPPTIENTNPGSRAKPTPCPWLGDLEKLARTVWKSGTAELEGVVCTTIWRGKRPQWWIEGTVKVMNPASGHYRRWTSLVAADDRTVVWSRDEDDLGIGTMNRGGGAEDFDGDGNDELWSLDIFGEGGASGTVLRVIDLTKLPPTEATIVIGTMSDAGAKECHGEFKFVDDKHAKLVDVTRHGDCSPEQRAHDRFRFIGDKLEPVAP
jgi:hypothetical protein